ncbi:MAG: Uma2 family endonuclease [Phycisphaerales bacterium]|nr:Uma2 family endonuclease [Phycisphaerales bacterium]MDB5355313.1 Uma2 family endonuclease [Phycisphaerales bacterium]
MAQSETATYTPEALLRHPDAVGYELVNGTLAKRHTSAALSRLTVRIGFLLATEADRTREATVYAADLGYQCFPNDPGNIRKPDISIVRKQCLKALQGDPDYMPIPADLAVEVTSPEDLFHDVAAKVEEYLNAGFGAVWVAYPPLKSITVYKAGGVAAVLHENDQITGEPALAGFRCRVGDFFQD